MSTKPVQSPLTERLAARGLRFTSQRELVYELLSHRRDHPTAEAVFLQAKQGMPDISMATVYNSLDTLVRCGLVKEVRLDRGASRYCPNMREHYHFHCGECGEVYDIELGAGEGHPPVILPEGFRPTHYEIAVRGICPQCAGPGAGRGEATMDCGI